MFYNSNGKSVFTNTMIIIVIPVFTGPMIFSVVSVFTGPMIFSVMSVFTGPMILMEHCTDGKLSDWLKNQSKVTSDVEDSMINFTIQVAAGMTHLHAAEVVLHS